MKKILFIILLSFCILTESNISLTYSQEPNMVSPAYVSVINLIANPEKFHQAKVLVIGFAIIEFERTALYLSKDCAEHGITKNAIWLDIEDSREYKKYDRAYISVEGIFDKDILGHLSLNSGTIKNISRIKKQEKRK